MSDPRTRKEFLADAAKYTVGAAAGVATLSAIFGHQSQAGDKAVTWPLPYAQLDVEKVRKAGHDAYWSGKGCSYGAFHALMSEIRALVGEPYLSIPSEIMIYGHGGGVGWGGLCGALNGPAAFISMVCLKARSDVLIHELFGWYTQTQFPSDISNQYAVESAYADNRYTGALQQNASGSILCHVSVTEWCKATQIAVGDTKRKERCARLTGDVAAYAAKLLNDEFSSQFTPVFTAPQSVTVCGTCHGSTGIKPFTAVKMECVQCHGNMHNSISTAVPATTLLAPTFTLEQNYPNPFNPKTTIEFSLAREESVTLGIHDLNGRLVRKLIGGEQRSAGTHRVQWDGTDDQGRPVASGIYFSRIRAGSYVATAKMTLMK
jgi:cytochrome c553